MRPLSCHHSFRVPRRAGFRLCWTRLEILVPIGKSSSFPTSLSLDGLRGGEAAGGDAFSGFSRTAGSSRRVGSREGTFGCNHDPFEKIGARISAFEMYFLPGLRAFEGDRESGSWRSGRLQELVVSGIVTRILGRSTLGLGLVLGFLEAMQKREDLRSDMMAWFVCWILYLRVREIELIIRGRGIFNMTV